LHELPRDRQPSPVPCYLGLLAQLHERFKKLLLILIRDADAGVLDFDQQTVLRVMRL